MRVPDSAVWCCGCAEWSPAMSTGGGDVWLRVRALCVAGVACLQVYLGLEELGKVLMSVSA